MERKGVADHGRPKPDRLDAAQIQALMDEAAPHRIVGRYEAAAALYARIERSDPAVVDAVYFLILMDLARGRPGEALTRLSKLIRWLPRSDQVWEAMAYARRELGQWREAAEASRRVLALRPGDTHEAFELTGALEVLGRIDEAIGLLRELAGEPGSRIDALIRLARLRPGAIDVDERAEIAAAAGDAGRAPEARAAAGFSLGEVLERAGRDDEAFAAFAAANRLKRALLTGTLESRPPAPIGPKVRALEPATFERGQIEAIGFLKAVFTPAFLAAHAGGGHHLAAPIFVVGMPRSGSSLVEQILSSHPKVQGLGETDALAETLQTDFPYALSAARRPDHFRGLAEAYLAAMHARGWTSAPRFVDKMLRNFMYVGAIHLMFPRALILHTTRDPVDTCLASFRQNFISGNEASYDLADIGRDYVRYREVMDHWNETLTGRVVEVAHEALVAEPEARIRWLVTEACGLAWDEACLRFHQTRRPVRTASVAQVRQPIFSTSLQRWRRYEKHLGPLFEALGPYAPKDV
jgi:tetratricopeptide (TPR) repeat protein